MGGWGLALQSGAPASQRTSMDPGTSWAQTEVAERISVNTKRRQQGFVPALSLRHFLQRGFDGSVSLAWSFLNTVSSARTLWLLLVPTPAFFMRAAPSVATGQSDARRLVIILLHCLGAETHR